MKHSQYNLFIPTGKVVVGYNSFSDSFVIIDKKIYQDFISTNLNEISLSRFSIQHEKSYRKLIDSGFIIPDEKDELDLIRLGHKYAVSDEKNLQIMIYPTQDCNLKCWYCYENHVTNSRMSPKVQVSVVKFIERYIRTHKLESLNLTFFGGEPLLSFYNIAYPLSQSIKSICEANKIYFSTFFISNATLVDEHMIGPLQDINAYFQITLDGCRDKHNQVRIGKKGAFPTFDRIIHALDLLSHHLRPIPLSGKALTLRINYDNDTLRNIENIFQYIQRFNKKAIFVHLERVWQTQDQINEEQIQLLINAIRLFAKNDFSIDIGTFRNKRIACPAERLHYAIFNYNGLVYRCNGRNLTEVTKEGILKENGEIEWDLNRVAKRLGRTTFENPTCLACKMLPQCMGPCSQKCMEHNWQNLENSCSLRAIDMSLEQYILLRCELEWIRKNREQKEK